MKSEQQRIETELTNVEQRIQTDVIRFESIEKNLEEALLLATRLGPGYCQGSDQIRRAINQALFLKIYVGEHGVTHHELQTPFQLLLSEPVINTTRSTQNTARGKDEPKQETTAARYHNEQ